MTLDQIAVFQCRILTDITTGRILPREASAIDRALRHRLKAIEQQLREVMRRKGARLRPQWKGLKQFDVAEDSYDRALAANPSNAFAWLLKGTMHAFKSEGEQAVEHTERRSLAARISYRRRRARP